MKTKGTVICALLYTYELNKFGKKMHSIIVVDLPSVAYFTFLTFLPCQVEMFILAYTNAFSQNSQ